MESMRRFLVPRVLWGRSPHAPPGGLRPRTPSRVLPVSGCAPSHWLRRWTPSRFCPSRVVCRSVGFVAVPLGCDRSGSDVVRGLRPGPLLGLPSRVVRCWWALPRGSLGLSSGWCAVRGLPPGAPPWCARLGLRAAWWASYPSPIGTPSADWFNRVSISSPNVVRRRLFDRRWQRRKPASLRPRSCVRPRFGNR